MVVFGGPVRDWVAKNYGKKLAVNDVDVLDVPGIGPVQVMASNHPSMLYNAEKKYRKPDGEPTEEGIGFLSRVMQQDLVAACWQVRMTLEPTPNGKTVSAKCVGNWTGKQNEMCILVIDQAFNVSEQRRTEICKQFNPALVKATPDSDVEKMSGGEFGF